MSQPRWQRQDPRLAVELGNIADDLRHDAPVRGPRKATRIAAFEQGVLHWIEEIYNPDIYIPVHGHWTEEE